MVTAVEFDFPIRRPNDRLVRHSIGIAAIRALLTAHRTRLVRICVDVNHIGHSQDYTADAGNHEPPSAEARRNVPLIHQIKAVTICSPSCNMRSGSSVLAIGPLQSKMNRSIPPSNIRLALIAGSADTGLA